MTSNPYAPPDDPSKARETTGNRLRIVWLWPLIAIAGAVAAIPTSDPLLILGAAAFALPCFASGVVWTSDLGHAKNLVTFALLPIAAAIAALVVSDSTYTIAMLAAIGVVNVYLGILAGRDVVQWRARIFLSLAAGYLVGLMFLWPLLSAALAEIAVLIADRSIALERSNEDEY